MAGAFIKRQQFVGKGRLPGFIEQKYRAWQSIRWGLHWARKLGRSGKLATSCIWVYFMSFTFIPVTKVFWSSHNTENLMRSSPLQDRLVNHAHLTNCHCYCTSHQAFVSHIAVEFHLYDSKSVASGRFFVCLSCSNTFLSEFESCERKQILLIKVMGCHCRKGNS